MNGVRRRLIAVFLFFTLIISVTAITLDQKEQPANFFGGVELASPSDWISEDQIKVYSNRVILELSGASWASFTDTNSMDPFLDENSNAIEIKPESADMINVGDVISYQSNIGIIIHRVINVGEDSEGVYYIVKGDNNTFSDPVKVRFDDVVGVVVAIVY